MIASSQLKQRGMEREDMAFERLAVLLFLYCTIAARGFDTRKVTCVESQFTFTVMGLYVKCLTEEGHNNCEKMGLFDNNIKECYKCCNNTAITAEPLTAITTANSQTVKKVPNAKTVQNQGRVLTTETAHTTEDVKETKSSNSLEDIGLPVLYGVCSAVTVVGIVFLVKWVIRRRRNRHAYRRQSQQPHLQPDRHMTYVGTPTQENLLPYSQQELGAMATGIQSSQETPV